MDELNRSDDATVIPGSDTRVRIGDRFRDWEVDAFLGAGSFGTVWRAHRNRLGGQQIAAIKVLDRLLVADSREQMVAEFTVLSSIQHPNLLKYLDAFEIEDGKHTGFVVFVLELADTDLRNAIDTSVSGLGEQAMCHAFADLADGLAAFHAAGHAHGDIKPANILRVGSTWKLADFGIAAPLDGSYSIVGGTTFDYCPPEELSGIVDTPIGSKTAGRRVHRTADVWALGISLHEAVSKRHPYLGDSARARLAAVLSDRRTIDPSISGPLADLFEHNVLTLDYHNRISSADLSLRLRQIAETPSVGAQQAPAPIPAPVPAPTSAPTILASPDPVGPVVAQPGFGRTGRIGVAVLVVLAVVALVAWKLGSGSDPAPTTIPAAPIFTRDDSTSVPSSTTVEQRITVKLDQLPPIP
jgi:serine/threonine protein kinase